VSLKATGISPYKYALCGSAILIARAKLLKPQEKSASTVENKAHHGGQVTGNGLQQISPKSARAGPPGDRVIKQLVPYPGNVISRYLVWQLLSLSFKIKARPT
jgi:hypothetical protein